MNNFVDKTCLQHVLQEIFSPQPLTKIQRSNKARDERIKNFPTEEQSHRTRSTESSNTAEINPKASGPDQCMYFNPCYSTTTE